jgi:hypothetical protein
MHVTPLYVVAHPLGVHLFILTTKYFWHLTKLLYIAYVSVSTERMASICPSTRGEIDYPYLTACLSSLANAPAPAGRSAIEQSSVPFSWEQVGRLFESYDGFCF